MEARQGARKEGGARREEGIRGVSEGGGIVSQSVNARVGRGEW